MTSISSFLKLFHLPVKGKTIKEIRLDVDFGCLYLLFSYNKVSKTVEHSPSINIDFDNKNELVGLEFIGVKKAGGNFRRIFVELAKTYNKPELAKVPSELKKDLAFV